MELINYVDRIRLDSDINMIIFFIIFAVMDSESSPINWIDDSSKPAGSFETRQALH